MTILPRSELAYLSVWWKRPDRKPLLIRGARQVGKSTLVRIFSEKEQLNLIELDFEKNPEYAELFKSQDPKTIVSLLSVQLRTDIPIASSLLFLDEIQRTPQVLSSLRYFYEKLPELAVISAGSLLDFVLKETNFSMPVGRIEYLYLNPLSYESFLRATQKHHWVEFLQQYSLGQQIPEVLHKTMLESLKTYFIVGGLPEPIVQYIASDNFMSVERSKRSLLLAYQEDFAKYASLAEQDRLRLIFNKIPRMLGEKFKYSHIDPEQKSTLLKTALHHLSLARIVHVVPHTDANGLPLGAEVNEKHFKTYFLDIGLTSSALDLNILSFEENQDFTLVNSGKIAKQFVAQELLQFRELYEKPDLYYWMREKKSSSAEVDFVIAFQGQVIPVEVKAGKTGTLKSMHAFLYEKKRSLGVRFCNQPPSLFNGTVKMGAVPVSFQLLSLPFYLIGQLKRLLSDTL
jgi:predicted AAA+ superfamily ATPase